MNRRKELENIIIGTLLESTEDENYFIDCRSCVTEDMFLDEVNRRLYGIISEMNNGGNQDTRPSSILQAYGASVADIVATMCELCTEYSFINKKMMHNEWEYLDYLDGKKPEYTKVQFSDYVNGFIKMVFV